MSKSDSHPGQIASHIGAGPDRASQVDRARFRLLPVFGGLEVMDGAFVNHHFAPHSHDEMMIGVLHAGSLRFRRGRQTHVVGRGGLAVVNPGDVHTGGRDRGEVLAYTALYPEGALLERAGVVSTGDFADAVLDDTVLWQAFFEAMREDTEPLRAEELLIQALAAMAVRYGDTGLSRHAVDHTGIRRTIDFIEACHDQPLTLDRLSRVAGVGTRHLIRSFRKAVGMTPHAFLRQVRVRRARDDLRCGTALAEAAYAAGFADQAHLTKAFKLLMGTTPGRYAACYRG